MKVVGVWEVNASHTEEVEVPATAVTPDEIADAVDFAAAGVSVCHQCASDVDGAELGDLVSFTMGNVDYVKRGDHWEPYFPKEV